MYANELGASGMAELFAAIVTARTWSQITASSSHNRLYVEDTARQKKLVMTNARSYVKEIGTALTHVVNMLSSTELIWQSLTTHCR